ncbi:peptidoglycan DD-metalloendopeptidase family protein [Gracilibacillus salitolerans]|uniref:Peptidoglycan DD-metalloendopeptidase family protein n=1 Tax=Gracilibacillus salitolerans TaxID=2663022 RepID=A0A5Q2TM12_9BACI|nr:peptidoglycan DD-metalloendopeptidase family protein [Gracilibacillus salitolerans]QGH35122.1 peptidoglycan DD-metalloendopeptidase family protein [Gracilibacillus salitolerans]
MATFKWPSDTKRITSKFRTSSRPNHNGVDIAEGGYHPIYAIAAGTVTKSYASDSYGEVIFIKHIINGQTYESVYAHMKKGSRTVFPGDRVTKGQQIGIMGNTGHSTGQHLHFELHKGRWNINKSKAVDPLKYLEKNLGGSSDLLKNGNEGSEVGSIQKKLKKLGYYTGRVDNDFGPLTDKAIRAFQKDQGIKVDGIVGPVTQSKLENVRGKTLYLPKAAPSWRVYPTNVAPVKGNEKAFLKPSKFGGLQYKVLDTPQKDVVTIKTKDFGKVNIYVAPSTGAVIK